MLNSYGALRDFSEPLQGSELEYARNFQPALDSMRYLEVLEGKSWGRKMFIASQRYLGLWSPIYETKWSFVHIRGGHIPFIVRENAMDGHYKLIGEAYVYGIMDSEFMARNPQIEHFTLS